jgi:hypothetical protein
MMQIKNYLAGLILWGLTIFYTYTDVVIHEGFNVKQILAISIAVLLGPFLSIVDMGFFKTHNNTSFTIAYFFFCILVWGVCVPVFKK